MVFVLLAIHSIGVFAAPQGGEGSPPPAGKSGGGGKTSAGAKSNPGGGPTGLGAILGSGARPGTGCAKLEVLIGWSHSDYFCGTWNMIANVIVNYSSWNI